MAFLFRFFGLFALVSALGFLPHSAHANNLARMLSETGIEPESLTLMQESAKILYTAPGKAIGDIRDWTNTDTGTAGRVEIVDIQNACVQLFHRVEAGRTGKVTELRTWRCRTASGEWQMSAKP